MDDRPASIVAEKLQRRDGTVGFVIPLYNEVDALPHLVSAIEAYRTTHAEVRQIVLVDDGSKDATASLARQLTEGHAGYSLISFSRNFGHQLAITAGIELVHTDCVVVLDADLQDPLEVVDKMTGLWKRGYDVVYGLRAARKGESYFKKATAKAFYRFFRWMTDVELPVDTGDFRLMSRSVIEAYKNVQEQQPFVRGVISWLGFNQIGIEYERSPRVAGETKYTLQKMWRLAMNSLASFSDKPLRLAVRFGLTFSILAVLLGLVWVVLAKFVFETAISGWASLLMVVVFLGGLNLFFLGVVGMYLSRVYDEVKARPRYVVAGAWSSTPRDATEAETTKAELHVGLQ